MREQVKNLIRIMSVVAVDGPNGGNMPQEWEIMADGHLVYVRQPYMEASDGFTGDPSGYVWTDGTKIPSPKEGELQCGYLDTGFCRSKFRVLAGLTAAEYEAVQARMQELIAATGRDLRDEFDGATCPVHGRYCTINGTQGCPSCQEDEESRIEALRHQFERVRRSYTGTRLYGAFRRAGLSIADAKALGF